VSLELRRVASLAIDDHVPHRLHGALTSSLLQLNHRDGPQAQPARVVPLQSPRRSPRPRQANAPPMRPTRRLHQRPNSPTRVVKCLSLMATYGRPVLLDCGGRGDALYDDETGFPSLDDRDKLTIQQDVRRSFTRFPGRTIRSIARELTGRFGGEGAGRIGGEIREDDYARSQDSSATALCSGATPSWSLLTKGYHDLAEVLILVSGDDLLACKLLHRMSLVNVRGTPSPALTTLTLKTCYSPPSTQS
jgi:hypothetical protein